MPADNLIGKGPTKATATIHIQLKHQEDLSKTLINYQRYCQLYTDNGPYVEYDMLRFSQRRFTVKMSQISL